MVSILLLYLAEEEADAFDKIEYVLHISLKHSSYSCSLMPCIVIGIIVCILLLILLLLRSTSNEVVLFEEQQYLFLLLDYVHPSLLTKAGILSSCFIISLTQEQYSSIKTKNDAYWLTPECRSVLGPLLRYFLVVMILLLMMALSSQNKWWF